MSGRPLDITQRQVRALCEGAKKAGYVPVIEIGKTVVKLVPENRVIPAPAASPVDQSKDSALDAELAAFEAEHGDR